MAAEDPIDPPPRTLDYQRPKGDDWVPPAVPKWIQATCGFFAWLAVLGITVGITYLLPSGETFIVSMLICTASLIAFGQFMHRRYHWTTFAPGVFLSIGLSILVPIIGIGILCGFFK